MATPSTSNSDDRKRGPVDDDDDISPSASLPVPKKTKATTKKGGKPNNTDEATDAIAELHVIIRQQNSEMAKLRATVEKQQAHIEFLMSIMGVSETTPNADGIAMVGTDQPGSSPHGRRRQRRRRRCQRFRSRPLSHLCSTMQKP